MALKKSELYSSLWSSCDELRGGMDASQYKDYVLVLLFIKYVSDKYAGVHYAPIIIPQGSSFQDMVALKGKPDIGDQINKKILGPLAKANQLFDMPDFNDATKLGSGKEMVERLTNLIAIFENPALDFSKNRAEGDDILGDAYEYLMRHFATDSGKSKGQFYTPAEVSRVIAQIVGIRDAATTSTTVYDPTCGSGSLLLKVADEARLKVTLYGQEKDAATASLAYINMILHDNTGALIKQGTLPSSTRVRAELHEPAFRRLGGTRAPWSSTTRRGRAQPDIYDPALKSAVSRSACPLRRRRADLPGPGGSTAWNRNPPGRSAASRSTASSTCSANRACASSSSCFISAKRSRPEQARRFRASGRQIEELEVLDFYFRGS